MSTILKYEIRKMVSRKSSMAAFVLIALSICTLGFIFVFDYSYSDSAGNLMTGYKAIGEKRRNQQAFAGKLSTHSMKEALHQYQIVTGNQSNYDRTTGDIRNDVYAQKLLPYEDILSILRMNYSPAGTYDYYILGQVDDRAVDQFYERRHMKVASILDMDYSYGNYSEKEKEFILSEDSRVNLPFTYDYSDGWEVFFTRGFQTVCLIAALGICVVIAPIFSAEYQTKADSIILSTKNGRRKLIHAKILAGFLVTVSMYLYSVTLFSLIVFSAFGISGWNCSFQMLSLNSFFNLTNLQVFIFGVVINLTVVLAVAAFTMLLSAISKTPFSAVIISLLLLLAPLFISTSKSSKVFNQILSLLPANSMNTFTVFSVYDVFLFGGDVVSLPVMIFILSLFFGAFALPLAYRGFRNHQVA